MSAPVSATETLKSFSVRYSLIRSRIATSSSTTRMWASTVHYSGVVRYEGILPPEAVESLGISEMNATSARSVAGAGKLARAAGRSPTRRSALVYFLLALVAP